MANTYLSRTQTASNRRTFTLSYWVKSGIDGYHFTVGSDNFQVRFASNAFFIGEYNSGSYDFRLQTSRLLRDPSAWYHIVVAMDTTQATDTNRVKIYINGVQETSFSTTAYPSQNYDSSVSTNVQHNIGVNGGIGSYFSGSMTHFHFIDGTAYDADDFGESDSVSGIWKPKTAPSVTYGTNGFFLKFENSGAMGTDSSGNTNTFTVNGTLTQNVDTPSNNFATLNILDKDHNTSNTFSNANLTLVSGGNGSRSSLASNSGKYYVEVKLTSGNGQMIGVQDISKPIDANTGTVLLLTSGATLYVAGSSSSYGSAWSAGNIMQIAMDLDSSTKKVYFGKDGSWWNGSAFANATPHTGTTLSDDTFYAIRCDSGVGTPTADLNFGNGKFGTSSISSAGTAPSEGGIFEYDCPSGYQALCTKGINSF